MAVKVYHLEGTYFIPEIYNEWKSRNKTERGAETPDHKYIQKIWDEARDISARVAEELKIKKDESRD
ncbi:hypothetical protein HYT56_05150 [Candidatus Woesearchaeota archaeon]|nr:hypothetical protein [Candidatus Woesearchaeota archaeon]